MSTVSHRARHRRARTSALVLCGAVALGVGFASPGTQTASAAPRCDHVSTDNRPELGEGSQGDAVSLAQCLIGTRSGYPEAIEVSGVFGPETAKAVLWVQACNKVPESGRTDAATWKVLYRAVKGCGKPRTPVGPKPSTVPDGDAGVEPGKLGPVTADEPGTPPAHVAEPETTTTPAEPVASAAR